MNQVSWSGGQRERKEAFWLAGSSKRRGIAIKHQKVDDENSLPMRGRDTKKKPTTVVKGRACFVSSTHGRKKKEGKNPKGQNKHEVKEEGR